MNTNTNSQKVKSGIFPEADASHLIKKIEKHLLVTLFLLCCTFQMLFAQFQYINPVPGSSFHNPETNIILKNGNYIDRNSVKDKGLVKIRGSKSGLHKWVARLSDDKKTVTIKPAFDFAYGETVTVTVNSKLKTYQEAKIEGTSFTFKIRNEVTPEQRERYKQARLESLREDGDYLPNENIGAKLYPLDSMPTFTINVNAHPAPGSIFYANHEDAADGSNKTNSFLTIIKNDGTIKWARDVNDDGRDFKINENGYLTYYTNDPSMFMVMDSNYNIIDSVRCTNGFEGATESHDFMMYPDGHAFLLAHDQQAMDMTAYGGLPDATVQALIVQELDSMKNLVFEWRSWDHFLFTDANSYVPLTNDVVDYCHGNSVQRDFDGNVLISCRNMSEITKIDHATGNIIWRMGGENNQFTFVNDNIPEHFHSQHTARRLPNGHIILFNNGNNLPVQISSAKEYAVDEVTKVATLVWYYEHPDVNGLHVYGSATGNAFRLPNGNTIINWGLLIPSGAGFPNHTEVDSNKNIVWEMTFDSTTQKTYRVFKYVWNPCSRITGYTMNATPKTYKATLKWGEATGAKSYIIEYNKVGNTHVKSITTTKKTITLTGLAANTQYVWQVKTDCGTNPNSPSGFSESKMFTTLSAKITDSNLTSPFSIYPNPADGNFTIDLGLDNEAGGEAIIQVISMVGQILSSEKCSVVNGALQKEMKLKDAVADEMYFVKVIFNDQVYLRQLVIEKN